MCALMAKAHNTGLKGFFRRLGPGLVTGAADDDPSGIGTHSQVGAQFGNRGVKDFYRRAIIVGSSGEEIDVKPTDKAGKPRNSLNIVRISPIIIVVSDSIQEFCISCFWIKTAVRSSDGVWIIFGYLTFSAAPFFILCRPVDPSGQTSDSEVWTGGWERARNGTRARNRMKMNTQKLHPFISSSPST